MSRVISIRAVLWIEGSKFCYLNKKLEGEIIANHPKALVGSIWVAPDYQTFHYIDEEHNERKLAVQPLVDEGVLVIDSTEFYHPPDAFLRNPPPKE